MKLTPKANQWVQAELKTRGLDPNNPGFIYQVVIEGYWSGHLDMDPGTGSVQLMANPTPKTASPEASNISLAIMGALNKAQKK
ncbi:MAG: hypothetical protein CME70_18905 [Halobacteriovorax sp.]|nr:hypothetical protein [Halobacteriovorax sp.]|tara:strand:+ start:5636 stop:5884 length:249 start_codon:yes stop_codon:yes gene_type:complete